MLPVQARGKRLWQRRFGMAPPVAVPNVSTLYYTFPLPLFADVSALALPIVVTISVELLAGLLR